jgi:ferritin-like metal-binding protein YciE
MEIALKFSERIFIKNSHMKKTMPRSQSPQALSPDRAPAFRDSKLEMLFTKELKEVYGAEKYQLTILPKVKKSASSLKLQNVLANHLDSTREQIARLEDIFEKLGQKAETAKANTLEGIFRECEIVIESTEHGTATRDAGLILVAQKLEHYEISTYGSLAQLARTLHYDEITEILETTLNEEKEEDELLTCVAENYVNNEARKE